MADEFNIDINLTPHLRGEESMVSAARRAVKEIEDAVARAGGSPAALESARTSLGNVRQGIHEAQRPEWYERREYAGFKREALAEVPTNMLLGPGGEILSRYNIAEPINAKAALGEAEIAVAIEEKVAAIRDEVAFIKQRVAAERGLSSQYIDAQTDLIKAKEVERGLIARSLKIDDEYIDARAETVAANKSISTQAGALAGDILEGDEGYIDANARKAQQRRELAAREVLINAGQQEAADLTGQQLITRAAVVKRVTALERQAAELNSMTNADIAAETRARAAKAQATAANEAQARAVIRQMTSAGQLQGTFFQRVQAQVRGGGKAPQEYDTFGQYFGQRALTTASYGIAGAVTYGAIQGVGTLLQDAQVLEQRFTRIKAQLDAFGEGESFTRVKTEILDISSATGQAADAIGETFQRFRGAFGETEDALIQTEAAMKLVTVTGGEVNSVIEDSIAANAAWGVSVTQLGDQILSLAEKTGVDADSLERFVGESAAAASAAGLSLKETAVIGATAAQELGKAPDQLAEPFSRSLSQISGVKEQILAIYQTTPGLAQNLNKVVKSFSLGDTGKVLTQIAADFDKLDPAERADLISRIGARKDAPFLTGLLRDSEALTTALQDTDEGAGTLNARFTTVEGTLKNVFQRVSQLAKELGDALLQAGIGELFEQIGIAIGGVIKGVTLLLGVFATLDDATTFIGDLLEKLTGIAGLGDSFPGLLSVFAQMAIVAALAAKAINFTRESVLGLGRASAESEQAIGKDGVVEASTRKTAAIRGETAAVEVNTAANRGNVLSETAQAGAKNASAAAAVADVGDDLPTVFNLPANTPANRLRNAGSSIAGSRLGSRLLSGGSFLRSETADATAAASGGPAGLTGAAAAGIALAGVIVVGQSYSAQRAEIEATSNSLKDQIKAKDTAALQKVRDGLKANSDGLQDFSVWLFGQESPLDSIEKELIARESAAGQKNLGNVYSTGRADRLIELVRDDQLSQIQDVLNTNDETKQAFLEAGGALNESAADRAQNVLALIPGVQDSKGIVEGLDREKLKAALPKLIEAAKAGDAGASEAVRRIDEILGTNADILALVNEANLRGDTDAAIEAAGGAGAYAALTSDESKAQLESGKISLASHIQNMERAITVGRAAAGTPEEAAKIDKLETEFQKTLDKRVTDLAKNSAQLRVASGEQSQTDADISAIQQVLADDSVSGTTKLALLPDLLSKTKAKFEADLEKIKDPIERYNAALTGPIVSPELQSLLVAQQLVDSDQAAQEISSIAGALGQDYDDLNIKVAEQLANSDKSLKQVELEIIDSQIDHLSKLVNLGDPADRGKYQAQLDQLQTLRDQILGSDDVPVYEQGNLGQTVEEAAAAEKKRVEGVRDGLKANAEIAKALAGGDAVAVAAIELNLLQNELAAVSSDPNADPNEAKRISAQIIRAQRDLNNAIRDIGLAQIELAAAYAQNPVDQAFFAQQIAAYQIQTAAMNNDRAGVLSGQASLVRARQQAADAQNAIIRSEIELAGGVSDDPEQQAAIALQLAQFDLAVANSKGDVAAANQARLQILQAQKQANEAAVNLMKLRLDLLAAGTQDPVELARIAQQQADLAAQNATTEAERIQAQIMRINADRQMADAISAIYDAQTGLAIAIAEAAGDSVRAAELGLAAARRALQDAVSRGAGDAATLEAQAEVVRSQAALQQAQFDDRLGDIEFAAQIGEITTAQQIEMLKALAALPGNTEEQIRQIRLKIKELQNQLSSDFQFNLPTSTLPTFYEARRVSDAQAQGIGYQDNRQVAVDITIIGADNPAAIANQIAQIIAGAGAGGPSNVPNPGRY